MPKKKVLLAFLSKTEDGPYEPLGIECIAGHLQKIFGKRVAVKLATARTLPEVNEVLKKISEWQPDIVGLSLFFNTLDFLNLIMNYLQSMHERPRVILGNILATFNAEMLLQKYPDCIVCLGSGEFPMQHFVENHFGKRNLSEVSGVAYKSGPKIIRSKVLPSPMGNPERNFLREIRRHKEGRIYLEASRGCPYHCSFCPQKDFFGFLRVEKSEKDLLEEIRRLSALTNGDISLLDFVDEDLLAGNKNALKVAATVRHLKKTGTLKTATHLMCSLSVHSILSAGGERSLTKLAEEGLRHSFVGVESFSQTQLKRLEKKHTPAEVKRALDILRKNKITYELGSIFFEPDTKLSDILQNCKAVRGVGIESISNPLNQWRALPCTEMSRRLKRRGLVTENYDPDWLALDWRYKNEPVAEIIGYAKKLESGLVLVESAIKRVYRSEMFFRLSTESKCLVMQCKHNLNSIFIDFLEEATIAAMVKKSISPITKHFEQIVINFLHSLVENKRCDIKSIREAATEALDLRASKKMRLALPQDIAKSHFEG